MAALSISIEASQTSQGTVDLPGAFSQRITKEIKVVTPDTTNNVTFTFAIIDSEGHTRYSISGLAENTAHLLLVERVVKPGYKFGVTPSGAPGNNCVVYIYPEYYSPEK